MERINLFLNQYKIPIALSIVGIILIIGGIFSSGIQKAKPKIYPQQSLITKEEKQISIDVSGSVKSPGVHTLKDGSRIEEAINLAGGYSDDADRDYISKYINLAQKISDGSKIYVPKQGEQFVNVNSSVNGVSVSGEKVNINTATSSQLEGLPGIGQVSAGKIIAGRPYQRIEDLIEKKVLGKALFDKLKEQLVVY